MANLDAGLEAARSAPPWPPTTPPARSSGRIASASPD